MQIFDFSNIENVYVVGDLHGEFERLFNDIYNIFNVKTDKKPKSKQQTIFDRLVSEKKIIKDVDDTSINNYEVADYDLSFQIINRANGQLNSQKKRKNMDKPSTLIIALGDCGFGFCKEKYYVDLMEKNNEWLKDNNITVLFLRGNHDDKSYFNNKIINFSNLITIPDYSVIKTQIGNFLCVGGGISDDRQWRIREEKKKNRYKSSLSLNRVHLYWKDENITFQENIFKELKENEIKIDFLLTHCPSSTLIKDTKRYNEYLSNVKYWAEEDKELVRDLDEQDNILNQLVEKLISNGHNLTNWYFGHLHKSEIFLDKEKKLLGQCVAPNQIVIVKPYNFIESEKISLHGLEPMFARLSSNNTLEFF